MTHVCSDSAPVTHEFRSTARHLLVELWGARGLAEREIVEGALSQAVDACQATLLHLYVHDFGNDGGITGVAVLSESHISIHTWPELGYAAIDVFTCGTCDPYRAIPTFQRRFSPRQIQVSEHQRGIVMRTPCHTR